MTTQLFNKENYQKEANVSGRVTALLTDVGYFKTESNITWEYVKHWMLTSYKVYFSQLTYDGEWTYTFTDIDKGENVVSKTFSSYAECREEAFVYTLGYILDRIKYNEPKAFNVFNEDGEQLTLGDVINELSPKVLDDLLDKVLDGVNHHCCEVDANVFGLPEYRYDEMRQIIKTILVKGE